MAKGKDPAFLFYPADASEDTQFMNRLERGCYFDLLKAQKKFRKFSLALIKKVLGQDFAQCWPAIESVLEKEGDLYFIGWANDAIENRAEHSAKQKKRIQEYWDKKKQTESIPNEYHGNTTESPNQNHGNTLESENGIVNENVIEKEIKNTIREKEKRDANDSRETSFDFTSPDIEGDEVHFPIDTKPVRELWSHWKKYRWVQHRMRYGMMGEQADLKRLEGLDYNRIESTILAAMANKWKNLYPDKSQHNGKSAAGINKKQQHMDSVRQSVASHYANRNQEGERKPDG